MAQPLSVFKNTKHARLTTEDGTVLTIERGRRLDEYANPKPYHTFVSKSVLDNDWWVYKVTFEPFDPARPKNPFPFVMIAPISDAIQAYQFYVAHGNFLLPKTDPTCSRNHPFCPITKRPPALFPSDQLESSTRGKTQQRSLFDFGDMPPSVTRTTFENHPPQKKEDTPSLKRKNDSQDQDTGDVGYFSKRKNDTSDDKKGLFGHSASSTSTWF